MDTLELCGDIFQPGGQLETPGLVQTQMFKNCWKPGVNAYTYERLWEEFCEKILS